MPKDADGETYTAGKCKNFVPTIVCVCDTDNCNHECSAVNCEAFEGPVCDANCTAPEGGPGKNDTNPTDTTNANDTNPNPTDDSAGATSEDGPQPTDDNSVATGEGGPQPTKDSNGATGVGDSSGATDEQEKQETTGQAATGSGNLRVVESNQSVFAVWILVTLVIRSFY